MRLSEFITEIGDQAAAGLFDVSERCAASWRRGERKPRPNEAANVVKKSNGKVSYEDIYAPVPNQRSGADRRSA